MADLTRALGLARSSVSGHLACLRDCRLVGFRIEDRQSLCALTRSELRELLRSAGGLLTRTGDAVHGDARTAS